MTPKNTLGPISVGIDEAARMIGVARSMFYEMIANDEIQTFKLGRRRLVRVKTLEAFIKRLSQENSR